ncbi:MAG: galactitol-1-phosphate 5-dehydrogenase [Eubacteriales bacterium]|nr:galactitol-1-phosphate 5-dehydrogenase [Eubacteriales bacterium]
MKAAVLVQNKQIEYKDIDLPQMQEDSVLVRVAASGICGSDLPRFYHNGVHFYPIVLGHEFSGEVVEVGAGVSRVRVGDRVSGAPLLPCMKCADCQKGDYSLCKQYSFLGSRQQGSNAEYIVLPERNAVVFDSSISFEKGAMFEPSTVALHGVLQCDYKGGGNVAILGGGTIGIFTLQWARLLGAKSVAVFDISPERLALAKRMGADAAFDTREAGCVETARASVHGGFDYVFETAGVGATMKMAYSLAANKAHLCFIGTPHADLTFTPAEWENMNRKEFRLTGSWMSYSAPFPGREWTMTAEYYADGRLKFDEAFIGARYPMERAEEAFLLFETPGAVNGKILLMNEPYFTEAMRGK